MAHAFLDEDFLLPTEPARRLYHDYAAGLPIYDYHCHLSPAEIARNRRFDNLTRIWLEGDHYKWRLMRAHGIDERRITGDATDREKLQAWAATVPRTIRNPIYHWTAMELATPFGVREPLNETTAERVWETCNRYLATDKGSVQGILETARVRVICTTDDPTGSLEHHAAIRASGLGVRVVPTFRPDGALKADNLPAWRRWIRALEAASGTSIGRYADLVDALRLRHTAFHEAGCRLSDHGIEEPYFARFTAAQLNGVVRRALDGIQPDEEDLTRLRAALMLELGRMNAQRGWTMQLHLSALRGTNTRMVAKLGPDTGYDSMGDWPIARNLGAYLDALESEGSLPRLILYGLNPSQNEVLATMAGNFQDGATRGKIQYGAAWWFNDQLDGMSRQMEALSSMGLLSEFVGMLTDSRSFLSYPRHDYFRRLLCGMIGADAAAGRVPMDLPHLGGIVQDIAWRNAVRYFGIPGVNQALESAVSASGEA